MNIQEWTSIISAGLAITSAISAHIDRAKADRAAKKALKAQEETAAANKELARLQAITNAREANQLLLHVDDEDEHLVIFNPFRYEVKNLRIDCFEVTNSPVTVEWLEPQNEAKATLKPKRRPSYSRFDVTARLKWFDDKGSRREQTWRFN